MLREDPHVVTGLLPCYSRPSSLPVRSGGIQMFLEKIQTSIAMLMFLSRLVSLLIVCVSVAD